MGCGLSWERTACPREGQPHILELSGNLGVVCLSTIPRTAKVNVGIQVRAAHPSMAHLRPGSGLAGRQEMWVLVPTLPSICCVTLAKPLLLSEHQSGREDC